MHACSVALRSVDLGFFLQHFSESHKGQHCFFLLLKAAFELAAGMGEVKVRGFIHSVVVL